MKAGQTNMEVGTRIRIQNVKGEDRELNGLIGSVTHPFAFGETKKGWVGVWLEGDVVDSPYNGQCNIRVSECEVVRESGSETRETTEYLKEGKRNGWVQ